MKKKWIVPIALAMAFVLAMVYLADDSHRGHLNDDGSVQEMHTKAAIFQDDNITTAVTLFSSGAKEEVVWTSTTPAAHRAHIVVPDTTLLTLQTLLKEGDRLILPIFDDAVLKTIISDVTRYPNGSLGMTAQLEGEHKGTVYLACSGGEMRLHAEVLDGNDFYVRYDPELQAHVAIEVDRASSDYQEDCIICRPSDSGQQRADAIYDGPSLHVGNPEVVAAAAPEDIVVVDVMVVYTPAALAYEGSTNGINNNITMAMQRANEVHGNSDTKLTMNLVYSAETTYTESGNASTDLDVLTEKGGANSAMDDVHIWRDMYSVDLVCLLESNPGTGGLGWLLGNVNGNPAHGFCLARVQQSDTSYTVVHEWGHNMGCSHSKTQALSPWEVDDLFPYSAGWQWADTAASATIGYCTVMTYTDFYNDGLPDEYERVPYFSNPDISYTGDSVNATGDTEDGDNARTIRNTRFAVADYRVPDIIVDQFPSSSSFEFGFSPWRFYGGTTDWEREDGTDGNIITNAPYIATTSAADGTYFIMTDGATSDSNTEALLEASFDFSSVTDPAINFSYCMYSLYVLYGYPNGATNTLQVSIDDGASWTSLWTYTVGATTSDWQQENISLAAYTGEADVRLRFKADLASYDNWVNNYVCLDAITVTGTVANPDIDGDGLPNSWEQQYFGGVTNATPGGNPDNDFYDNLAEYIAGLNPTVADSFGPTNLSSTGATSWFEWAPVNDRLYNVYWTSNLLDGFSLMESGLTSGLYTDEVHSAEQQGFYMLEVELAP